MPKVKHRFCNTSSVSVGISERQLLAIGGLLADAAPESIEDIFRFISKFVLLLTPYTMATDAHDMVRFDMVFVQNGDGCGSNTVICIEYT